MDNDDNTPRNKRPRLHSPDRDLGIQPLPQSSLVALPRPVVSNPMVPIGPMPPPARLALSFDSRAPLPPLPPRSATSTPGFPGYDRYSTSSPVHAPPLAASTLPPSFAGFDHYNTSSTVHGSSLYNSMRTQPSTLRRTQLPSIGSIDNGHGLAGFKAPPANGYLPNTPQTNPPTWLPPLAPPRLETPNVQHQLRPPGSVPHERAPLHAVSAHVGGVYHNRHTPPSGRQTPASPSQPIFAITGGTHVQVDNRRSRVRNNIYLQGSSASGMAPDALRNNSALSAVHSSSEVANQGICMPGTRAFTLQRLQSLLGSVQDTDPDLVWMHGPVGAGKSAIMRTMANALEEQGVLLGSFFFFRADSQRNTCTPLIPTLALQALTSLPATHHHIQNAVQTQHMIFTQSIERQLRFLLETPLTLAAHDEATWRTDSPFVIVIDGLDECSDADRQVEIIRAMRRLVSSIRSSTGRRIKVLIASRPEARIKEEFEANEDSVTIVKLEPDDSNTDLYYDVRLDEIRRRNKLPESWPAPEQIKWLKKKTSGQYAFAHISMGFLGGGDPVERLKMLEVGIGTHGLEPFEALDALYAFVLHQVPPEMRQSTLRVIWFARRMGGSYQRNHHLVEDALSLPLGYLRRVYPYLSSVLKEDNFSPHHASLFDFLGDPLRSRRYSLSIDLSTVLTAVVEGALRVGITASEHGRVLDPEDMKQFARWVDTNRDNLHSDLCHISPRILEALAFLPSLLPTMDAFGFGYYCFILSLLEDTPYFLQAPDTLRPLLDQISALQPIHFAPYILLEREGDSGVALFGLLLVVASEVMRDDSPGVYPYGLELVAPNVICNNQHLLSPITPLRLPQSRILHEIAHQSCATERPDHDWWTAEFYIRAFVPSSPDNVVPRECLSRTVELFLDLPSATTRIQTQLVDSRLDKCRSHAIFHVQCKQCLLTLESLQIVGLRAVYWFWCCTYNFMGKGTWFWGLDLDVFARASEFVMGTTSLIRSTTALVFNMFMVGRGYASLWTDYPSPEFDLERLKGIVAKLGKREDELRAIIQEMDDKESGTDDEESGPEEDSNTE